MLHRATTYHRTQALAELPAALIAFAVAVVVGADRVGLFAVPALTVAWVVMGMLSGRPLREEDAARPGDRLATEEETRRVALEGFAPVALVSVVALAVLIALAAGGAWIVGAVLLSEAIEDAIAAHRLARRDRARHREVRVVRSQGVLRRPVPGSWTAPTAPGA